MDSVRVFPATVWTHLLTHTHCRLTRCLYQTVGIAQMPVMPALVQPGAEVHQWLTLTEDGEPLPPGAGPDHPKARGEVQVTLRLTVTGVAAEELGGDGDAGAGTGECCAWV